jgi:basic membrane lipoprotein Med (substrate-binding protein (PBP1-ABC) superfamily)
MRSTNKPKLWRLFAALFSMVLVAAACGGDAEPAETTTTADAGSDTTEAMAEPISMAIVAPSAKDDLAFTQSMVDSINSLGDQVDLQITDGTFVVEEAAAAIRGYAEAGVEIIVAHGTQYGGSLAEIAPDFPETTFVWGTASSTDGIPNVHAYFPAADEGGYVLGTIAAALSPSGKIGVVGPVEAGDAVAYIDGFANGARDSGATEVSIVYTGSFGDVSLATETANAHLANGAEVLTGSAQMVVGAIGVAAQNDIPWFGTQANQAELAPAIVVASQVYHWENMLQEVLDLRAAGTVGGQVFEINLANGGLVIEFNDAYGLDSAVKDAAEAMIAAVADGSKSTGV